MANDGYIGYDTAKINDLMTKIHTSTTSLKSKFTTGWSTLQTEMRTLWNGPDEFKNEVLYAKDVQTLWESVFKASQVYCSNMHMLGESYDKSVETNSIDGSNVDMSTKVQLKKDPMEGLQAGSLNLVKETVWKSNGNPVGVKPGADESLSTDIVKYHKGLRTLCTSLYSQMETTAAQAFTGGEQEAEIKKYTAKIKSILENMTDNVKAILEALYEKAGTLESKAKDIATKLGTATVSEDQGLQKIKSNSLGSQEQ